MNIDTTDQTTKKILIQLINQADEISEELLQYEARELQKQLTILFQHISQSFCGVQQQ